MSVHDPSFLVVLRQASASAAMAHGERLCCCDCTFTVTMPLRIGTAKLQAGGTGRTTQAGLELELKQVNTQARRRNSDMQQANICCKVSKRGRGQGHVSCLTDEGNTSLTARHMNQLMQEVE